jgi:hypothetical protein
VELGQRRLGPHIGLTARIAADEFVQQLIGMGCDLTGFVIWFGDTGAQRSIVPPVVNV